MTVHVYLLLSTYIVLTLEAVIKDDTLAYLLGQDHVSERTAVVC